jgi:hypothetical protein
MKKSNFILAALAVILTTASFAQAVRDRNVIPVAVNLNEVLRMTITNGGNIEFVFNTIDDYRDGLSGDAAGIATAVDPDIAGGNSANPVATTGGGNAAVSGGAFGQLTSFYMTEFTVASSTRWAIDWGAEEATFRGTDNPANNLDLDNVGLSIAEFGTHNFEATATAKGGSTTAAAATGFELFSGPTDNGISTTALVVYPAAVALIEDNDDVNDANAGDGADNSFRILWRCGTTESGNGNNQVVAMETVSLLNQGNIVPDRYVTNVVFELRRDF